MGKTCDCKVMFPTITYKNLKLFIITTSSDIELDVCDFPCSSTSENNILSVLNSLNTRLIKIHPFVISESVKNYSSHLFEAQK